MEKVSPLYNNAVQQIKSAILESQLEAARAVNKQMLSLYYAVGQFVSENSREGAWGTGAIENISAQLRREMPGLRGFSATSIKKMRRFYEEWNYVLNRPPTAGDLENTKNEPKTPKLPIYSLLNINRPPMAGDLDFNEFLALSFVQYLLQDYNQPMGVATYKTMPDRLKSVLPDEKLLLDAMRKKE